MASSWKVLARRIAELAIASIPWILAMYAFFWLDSSGTWTSETPHRGKISVAILASGMVLSFLAWSWLTARRPK